jgi:prepilin peptidase CpaA
MVFDLMTIAVLLIGFIASIWNIKTRRIPNILTFGAPIIALVVHLTQNGVAGGQYTLGGWALGMIIFLPFFVTGDLGGGDVKLLAAFGAWIGPWSVVQSAIVSGILCVMLVFGISLGYKLYTNLWADSNFSLNRRVEPKIPYAIPISLGVLTVLWL